MRPPRPSLNSQLLTLIPVGRATRSIQSVNLQLQRMKKTSNAQRRTSKVEPYLLNITTPQPLNLLHHRERQVVPVAAFVVSLEGVISYSYGRPIGKIGKITADRRGRSVTNDGKDCP